MPELIIDSFAGGGGASQGIFEALGRHPDYAINHDDDALAMHAANHPETVHLSKNIYKVDPMDVVGRNPVGLLWASPDCKHFSKAKGGRPVKRNIRDLAWVVVSWAKRARPRVIILENVEEFQDWGPVGLDGKPCADRKGKTFKKWVATLRRQGYCVEWRELRACDYGAPTIRKRLFLIARRDNVPIVWPEPTHGPVGSEAVISGQLQPWRSAAEIIDWSLPCPSIFLTKEEGRVLGVIRPLAFNTMARIARGVKKYVLDAALPFIVQVQNASNPNGTVDLRSPMQTITANPKGGGHALLTPFVSRQFSGSIGHSLDDPSGAITAGGGGKSALVTAFLAQHNTGVTARAMAEPLSTIVSRGSQQQLVAAHMLSMRGSDRRDRAVDQPLETVTAGGTHAATVCAFLSKYYGTGEGQDAAEPMHTLTVKDRFSVVTVEIGGEPYTIVDIGMRMLTAREMFRAQGFPETYQIDHRPDGSKLTKTAQVRLCGNSVCPPIARALVAANCNYMSELEIAA